MSQRTPQQLQHFFDHPGYLLLRFLDLFLSINVFAITHVLQRTQNQRGVTYARFAAHNTLDIQEKRLL